MKTFLEIRTPKDAEETPEAMMQVAASLKNIKGVPLLLSLFKKPETIAFEIASFDQIIHFYAAIPESFAGYFESQLTAQYPQALIYKTRDYLDPLTQAPFIALGQLIFTASFYLPLKTYRDFRDVDPLSSILGVMAKAQKGESMLVQVLVQKAGRWRNRAAAIIEKGITDPVTQRVTPHPQKTVIEKKIAHDGFRVGIRLLTSSQDSAQALALLKSLAGAFGSFGLSDGNSFSLWRPRSFQKKRFFACLTQRAPGFTPRSQVLNIEELASVWHPPTLSLSGIKNIAWGRSLAGEPPVDLPVAEALSPEEKKEINFLARTEFKNKITTFGIKRSDRRRHIYIIGKTGTGKTTLIANMAINDIRNGEGLAIIDPHGDLCNILLDYIPSYRVNDVCYLNPADFEHPFRLNPLEVRTHEHAELVASGIVSIFQKLYYYSWGPRLEYILRNALLTLTQVPDATLVEVPEILANQDYRKKIANKIEDKVLKSFWLNEFNQMSDRLRSEAISPILNKVGQFVSSPMIRNILRHPKSTVNLEEIMNQGKILIVNLSSGKLGEDNSALLGAMFVTKIQLAAMARVHMPEEKRRDFYLYVDEFQNFATESFVKILSEARKYRLNICVANQYIGQLTESIQKAIFGNAGTLISFLMGAEDANLLSREFGQIYKQEDLVALGKYQVITKLAIEGLTSTPFPATTMPLPRCVTQNRDKVIRLSRERYAKPVKKKE